MKLALAALCLIIPACAFSMEREDLFTTHKDLPVIDLFEKCYEQYKKLTELLTLSDEKCKQLFGYNPQFEVVSETDTKIANPEQISIVPHGFEDSKEGIKALKKAGSFHLPGTLIVYNCPEVYEHGRMNITHANLGQLQDMKPMLYALAQCQNITNRIHLRGFSRAGAIAVNCMAALADYDKYQKEFERLNIGAGDARVLLGMIQQGLVVLECPLISVKGVIEKRVTNALPFSSSSSARNWFSSAVKNFSVASFNLALSSSTNYNPGGEQSIISAQILAEKKIPFNIFIHTENNDDVVANDPTFAQLFSSVNPEHTHQFYGACNHTKRDPEFYKMLQWLNKKYGAAYDREILANYCQELIIKHSSKQEKK